MREKVCMRHPAFTGFIRKWHRQVTSPYFHRCAPWVRLAKPPPRLLVPLQGAGRELNPKTLDLKQKTTMKAAFLRNYILHFPHLGLPLACCRLPLAPLLATFCARGEHFWDLPEESTFFWILENPRSPERGETWFHHNLNIFYSRDWAQRPLVLRPLQQQCEAPTYEAQISTILRRTTF